MYRAKDGATNRQTICAQKKQKMLALLAYRACFSRPQIVQSMYTQIKICAVVLIPKIINNSGAKMPNNSGTVGL